MGYFFRLGRAIINKSFAEEWLSKAISTVAKSASGVNVTPDKALESAAVYACIKVLSETVASLPLQLFKRRKDGGRDSADGESLSDLIHTPNDFQTSYEWIENLVTQVKLRGNAYHKIIRYSGKINQLIPLSPSKMEVTRENGSLIYRYTYEDGTPDPIPAKKIWHLKELSIKSGHSGYMSEGPGGGGTREVPEGIMGISPIRSGRETIGLSLAQDEYGARYFSNNATIGMALKTPGKLSEHARKNLKDSLAEYGRMENKWKSIIFEEGIEPDKLAVTNVESQLIQSRNFQIEEIARIFRVPAVLIGHPNKTMTYASAEQLFLNFVIHTIRPLCVRIERSMNRWLLSDDERGSYYFEFNLDGLLRGDVKARNMANALGRQWGWLNVDEIRQRANMNPLPDGKGEIYLEPMNMKQPGEEPDEQDPKPPGENDNE